MVVAQLVERSPPIPEVCCLNPVIGKKLLNIYILSTVLKRRKKEKEAGNGSRFSIRLSEIIFWSRI